MGTKTHGALSVAYLHLHYLRGKTSKLNENDIYSTIEKQEIIVNIYSDILEVRENLKEDAVK